MEINRSSSFYYIFDCTTIMIVYFLMLGAVAQCIELATDYREVPGSNPSGADPKGGQVRFSRHSLCLSDETLYAFGQFNLVYMPEEVKYPRMCNLSWTPNSENTPPMC